MKKQKIVCINFRAIEIYKKEEKEYNRLNRRIEKMSKALKELKSMKKNFGYYLSNLKEEREEALKFTEKHPNFQRKR